MPQMSPLSWLILMIFFTLVFIVFKILNYYSFLYENYKSEHHQSKSHINWKW